MGRPRELGRLLILWAFVRLWLVLILLALPPDSRAASPQGRIAFIGTNAQIYTCTGDCAKPECITCPSEGLHVRRRSRSNLHPASLIQEERPAPRLSFGWPTISPDGKLIAFGWAGRKPDGTAYGLSVYDFLKHET